YLRPVDDAEVAGTVARRRIAEHRIVPCILRFDAELDALAPFRPPVLDQGRVEHVDPRPAHIERARRGAKRVRRGTRERVFIEVVVQAVVNRPWRRRVADQVRALRAIPERTAGLVDLQRETGLQREEPADLPAADHRVYQTARAGAETAPM